jgi:hypothetical protein
MIVAVRPSRLLLCGLACTSALIAAPATFAGTPPNPNDPCVKGTRDTCNTTGIGYYKTYRYGTRWFGDFKNAIPGVAHSYCIDLRYWYPDAAYSYKEDTSGSLTNKDGDAVPVPNRQRIAYATWIYGRSSNPDQAAAVMLYVHAQMGDARAGEVHPSVLGSNVSALYDRISRDATKFHGPYRFEIKVPAGLKVGTAVSATVRVLAAGGSAVPNLPLTLSVQGATGISKRAKTDGSGFARITLTPGGGPLKLSASTSTLPSTLPRVFEPTSGSSAANGQRLVLPAAQTLSDSAGGSASKTQIRVSTAATPSTLVVGKTSQDRLTISNAGANWSGTIQVRIYGPRVPRMRFPAPGRPRLRERSPPGETEPSRRLR